MNKITNEMREKWQKRIQILKQNQSKLSDWELDFLDSIDLLDDLSIRQSFKLGEIYNRITG